MIKVSKTDLLREKSGIIVHGVNAQGKFAAGFANKVAMKYPQVYLDYMARYKKFGLKLGEIIVTDIAPNHIFVSGVSQKFYGRVPGAVYVDYSALIEIFGQVNELALAMSLPVKFPKIGCGLAHGNWPTVEGIIEDYLAPSIEKILFDPYGS